MQWLCKRINHWQTIRRISAYSRRDSTNYYYQSPRLSRVQTRPLATYRILRQFRP